MGGPHDTRWDTHAVHARLPLRSLPPPPPPQAAQSTDPAAPLSHIQHMVVPAPPGASKPQPSLPRSLAPLTALPALRSLSPPTLDWLRAFFHDLRPQQPHVRA